MQRALAPSKEEMDQLYAKLNQCKIKAVALSLIDPFAEQFIDQSRSVPVVSELFHTDDLSLGYSELLAKRIQVQLNSSAEQIKLVEGTTRSYSQGTGFFNHRAGRIGASRSGAVFHTNLSLPSQSLIKTICYSGLYKLNTTAVKHGCKHEDAAIQAYETVMKKSHTNFQVKKCGLFIYLALSGALRDMLNFMIAFTAMLSIKKLSNKLMIYWEVDYCPYSLLQFRSKVTVVIVVFLLSPLLLVKSLELTQVM